MMRILMTVLIGLAAVGCQTGFNRESMNASLEADQPLVFDDADVLRVEQTRPQLQFPIRLAVVPPTMFNRRGSGERRETEGQRKEIMAWGEKLRDAGIVSDLFVIPDILTSQTRSQDYIKDLRVAAARLQADAILILRSTTDVDSYANLLGVLDLTIVGMFVIPAHQKDALTIVEGMVFDNRNQYVYFAGSAEGLGTTFGPLASIEDRDAVRDSRREALRAFGELLLKEGQRMRDWMPGPRYSSPGQR
jgi:rhombotail lipoprotein